MKLSSWVAVIVLVILGVYLLVFHADPLPANHETIGLGDQHVVHSIVGILLLIGVVLIIWRGRRSGAPATP
ncbi:MAG TPA: hypothetical protein VIL58_03820 [Thermoplasmata archaeon]